MYKVQLTFTTEEADILAAKASRLGYSVTKYIKLLAGKEVLSEIEKYPTFVLSKKARSNVEKAYRQHKVGKTRLLSDIDDLDSL